MVPSSASRPGRGGGVRAELAPGLAPVLLGAFPGGVASLDVETTGLSPLSDRIVELSGARLLPDGGLALFDSLADPGVPIPPRATAVHGVTDAMAAGAPAAGEVVSGFLRFARGLPLVAHNARFDAGFLVSELRRVGAASPPAPVHCSLAASRRTFADMPDHRLGTLARGLGVPLPRHHRALDDALASLAVLAEALKARPAVLGESRLFDLRDFGGRSFELPERLRPLLLAIGAGGTAEIRYRGGSRGDAFRPVEPQALVPWPGGNVLHARCLLSGETKHFLVRRIVEAREAPARDGGDGGGDGGGGGGGDG